MEKVAQVLRQAREHRGMSIEEAAQRTKIPLSYLVVLEGKLPDKKKATSLLPDPMYLIPHLRHYADFLDLDPSFTVARFTEELQTAQEKIVKIAPAEQPSQLLRPPSHRSRAISISIVLASVLITLAFIGQYNDMSARSPGGNEPRILTPIDPSSLVQAPQVSPAPPAPAAPTTSPPPQTPPATTNSPTASPTLFPGATGAMPQPGTEDRLAAASPQPSGASHQLRAQAKEATWIRVLVEGQPPKEMILRPGQSAVWTSDSTFQITVGNAGGVILNLDGQDLPPLGKSGQVIRNIRLPFSATENQG